MKTIPLPSISTAAFPTENQILLQRVATRIRQCVLEVVHGSHRRCSYVLLPLKIWKNGGQDQRCGDWQTKWVRRKCRCWEPCPWVSPNEMKILGIDHHLEPFPCMRRTISIMLISGHNDRTGETLPPTIYHLLRSQYNPSIRDYRATGEGSIPHA